MIRLAVVLFCLVSATVTAEKSRWQIGGHAVAGLPQGEFRDVVPDTRWGGLGYFTRRFRETPFRFGIEVGAVVLDSATVELDRPEVFFVREAQLSSDMLFGHFLGRLQPVFGRFSPYVEGAIGARAFESSITYFGCVGPCNLPTSTSQVTFSAGGGGGAAVRLRDDGEESGLSIEVRARYLFGGSTDYAPEVELPDVPELRRPSPSAHSRTDLWMLSFGLVFDF